jgi:TolB protein
MSHFMPKHLLSFAIALLLAAGLAGVSPPNARADVVIDVNHGAVQPLPIAIPTFAGGARADDITKVLTSDLVRSGLFKPLDPSTFVEKSLDINLQPQTAAWKQIGAQALVYGQVGTDPDGRMSVNFRIWDVYAEHEIYSLRFTASPESWRRVAHKVADTVYEKLTGEGGYFDTRIVFVAESGPKTHRQRRLGIMDQDGANPSYLPTPPGEIFSPHFSSNSQQITFMTLRDEGSAIYLYSTETGRSETLGHFQGMAFAPQFGPDGNKVTFSVERFGNTDIYVMDLNNRSSTRLTTDPSIDTSPSFSPNGGQIVFNSDRGGSPQLYVMNADGSNQHRISFAGGRYNAPVWSPRGDLIAFVKQVGPMFSVGVMTPDGKNERILSSSYFLDSPTWAPNGRVLMFARQQPGGESRLWTVDVTGRILDVEPYPGSASDPAWSPLLN